MEERKSIVWKINILKPLSKLILVCFLLMNLLHLQIKANEINACIRKAVENKIKLNRILTLCRDNIRSSEVYSNSYVADNRETSSDYISTNKTDEIIHKFIEKGDLKKAGRLAERLEIEKTKRIQAKAEAEALKAPQIIATNTTTDNIKEDNNNNIRSILTLGNNPIASIAAGSKVLEITTPAAHGAIPGQYVTISNINGTIDGIAASEMNTLHVITSVPSVSKFRISVLSPASAGSISGGGTDVIATFQN